MILFYLLAIVLIASAIFTISQKSPVYSVVGLLTNFIALAALYFTLQAEFLGIIQIVVYSGAILMLFVFVIALLSSGIGPFAEGPDRMPRAAAPALAVIAVAFGFLVYGMARTPFPTSPAQPIGTINQYSANTSTAPVSQPHYTSTLGATGDANVFGSVADFGRALFSVQLLPFEATALVLMVAVIGVVLLAGDAPPQRTLGHHTPKPKKSDLREPIAKAGPR